MSLSVPIRNEFWQGQTCPEKGTFFPFLLLSDCPCWLLPYWEGSSFCRAGSQFMRLVCASLLKRTPPLLRVACHRQVAIMGEAWHDQQFCNYTAWHSLVQFTLGNQNQREEQVLFLITLKRKKGKKKKKHIQAYPLLPSCSSFLTSKKELSWRSVADIGCRTIMQLFSSHKSELSRFSRLDVLLLSETSSIAGWKWGHLNWSMGGWGFEEWVLLDRIKALFWYI